MSTTIASGGMAFNELALKYSKPTTSAPTWTAAEITSPG